LYDTFQRRCRRPGRYSTGDFGGVSSRDVGRHAHLRPLD
jgi:hypothetical protein